MMDILPSLVYTLSGITDTMGPPLACELLEGIAHGVAFVKPSLSGKISSEETKSFGEDYF
jgi:hypothetical protein